MRYWILRVVVIRLLLKAPAGGGGGVTASINFDLLSPNDLFALVRFCPLDDCYCMAAGSCWSHQLVLPMGRPFSAQSADLHSIWCLHKCKQLFHALGQLKYTGSGSPIWVNGNGRVVSLARFRDNIIVATKGPGAHYTMRHDFFARGKVFRWAGGWVGRGCPGPQEPPPPGSLSNSLTALCTCTTPVLLLIPHSLSQDHCQHSWAKRQAVNASNRFCPSPSSCPVPRQPRGTHPITWGPSPQGRRAAAHPSAPALCPCAVVVEVLIRCQARPMPRVLLNNSASPGGWGRAGGGEANTPPP